jgi:hypothetical protein
MESASRWFNYTDILWCTVSKTLSSYLYLSVYGKAYIFLAMLRLTSPSLYRCTRGGFSGSTDHSAWCLSLFTTYVSIVDILSKHDSVAVTSAFLACSIPPPRNIVSGEPKQRSGSLRPGRSSEQTSLGAKFSAPVQTGSEAHPACYTMGIGSFPGVKRPERGVDHPSPSSAEAKASVELWCGIIYI